METKSERARRMPPVTPRWKRLRAERRWKAALRRALMRGRRKWTAALRCCITEVTVGPRWDGSIEVRCGHDMLLWVGHVPFRHKGEPGLF